MSQLAGFQASVTSDTGPAIVALLTLAGLVALYVGLHKMQGSV